MASCLECHSRDEKLAVAAQYGKQLLESNSRLSEALNVALGRAEQAELEQRTLQVRLDATSKFLEESEAERMRMQKDVEALRREMKQKTQLLESETKRGGESEKLVAELRMQVEEWKRECQKAKKLAQEEKIVEKIVHVYIERKEQEEEQREERETSGKGEEGEGDERVSDDKDERNNKELEEWKQRTARAENMVAALERRLVEEEEGKKEAKEKIQEEEKEKEKEKEAESIAAEICAPMSLETFAVMCVAAIKARVAMQCPDKREELAALNPRALFYNALAAAVPFHALYEHLDHTILDIVAPSAAAQKSAAPPSPSLWDALFSRGKQLSKESSVRGWLFMLKGPDHWELRFVLCQRNKLLWGLSDVEGAATEGEISLSSITSVEPHKTRPMAFLIKTAKTSFAFAARSEDSYMAWMTVLAKFC